MFFFIFCFSQFVYAGPQGVTFQGQLLKDGVVVENSNVDVTFKITSMPVAGTRPECTVFEESYSLNMTASNGIFLVTLGTGTRTANDLGLAISNVFANSGTLSSLNCVGAPTATAYTPLPTDSRNIYVSFVDGPDTVAFAQPYVIQSVPYAIEAERLSTATSSGFLQTSNDTTQSKVDAIFASTPYAELLALINGTSTSFAGLAGGNLNLGSGRIGVGTTNPSSDLSFGGNVARTIAMERATSSQGNNLTVAAGGATSSSTNQNGGTLNLSSGISTGAGASAIQFQTSSSASSGTASNTPSTRMTLLGNGNVGIGNSAPTELLELSALINTPANAYLRINGAGGSIHTNGIKLRFYDDYYGFTINNEDIIPRGLNILRHESSYAGISALFIDRGTGNVGLGTNSPSGVVEAVITDPSLRIRNAGDFSGTLGSYFGQSYGKAQLGMYNISGALQGAIPANGNQTFFGMNPNGAVGSMSGAFGNPVFRNLIDDGVGNATFSGNVGIGTTSAAMPLVVQGATGVDLVRIATPYSNFTFDRYGGLSSSNGQIVGNDPNLGGPGGYGSVNSLYLTSGWGSNSMSSILLLPSGGGNVGIGTNPPNYKLDVNGDINIASANALRFGGTQVCSSTGCTSPSDARLKEDIEPLQNSLENILKLQGVNYHWKNQSQFGKQNQVGLIAQEVEAIYPETVKTDSESGFKSIAYDHLVAPVIESIKSIYEQITALRNENAVLKEKVSQLEFEAAQSSARFERLEKLISPH